MEGEDRVRSASLKAKLNGRLSHIFSTNKREEREVIKLETYHFINKDRFSRRHLLYKMNSPARKIFDFFRSARASCTTLDPPTRKI